VNNFLKYCADNLQNNSAIGIVIFFTIMFAAIIWGLWSLSVAIYYSAILGLVSFFAPPITIIAMAYINRGKK